MPKKKRIPKPKASKKKAASASTRRNAPSVYRGEARRALQAVGIGVEGDPHLVLESLRGKASDRKLRLFACNCCRHVWRLLKDKRSRRAVEVAERFADRLATAEELAIAQGAARDVWAAAYEVADDPARPGQAVQCFAADAAVAATETDANSAAFNASRTSADAAYARVVREATRKAERLWQSGALHDIFGSSARRAMTANAEWLTSTVVSLAQAIYNDRAFDRLPILADALEDAGCTNQDILTHCRSGGEHVRGCWVVDLVLEKE